MWQIKALSIPASILAATEGVFKGNLLQEGSRRIGDKNIIIISQGEWMGFKSSTVEKVKDDRRVGAHRKK